MPRLSLLGGNNCLLLFNMDKHFIWLNETKQLIYDFIIGYMINPGLNVNKSFIEKVKIFIFTTFGVITQPFIKATLAKQKYKCVSFNIFSLDKRK